MVKINFDKYDASCRDNVWTWYIPNKDNTKNIKVIVEFPPVPIADSINEGQLKVQNIYFEEKENKLNYKKLYTEIVEKILKYDHDSYGYIDTFNDHYNEFELGADGFLTDEQLSEIQDSSELYKIVRDVYKNAPKVLTDFNKRKI
jgi:hypothetical protein